MSSEAAHVIAYTIAASTVLVTVAAPQGPLSDLQIIAISAGLGMAGGLVGALIGDEVMSPRNLAKRVLASGIVAPALVTLTLLQLEVESRLLHVVGVSGVVGIVAYPIATVLPKMAPAAIRDAIKKWIGGGGPGNA
jgi:hypothetical protein